MNRPSGRIRSLVVDDELLARRRLVAMLAAEPELDVIREADSGSAAVAAIARERPDLVFLDVRMPGLDGFGVLRCTANLNRPVIVFVTAHDEYAVQAFEVHASDYLLKPVTAARLHEAVRRAVARVRTASRREHDDSIDALLSHVPPTPATHARIAVPRADGVGLVAVADIVRVEADGDHARLHTTTGVHVVRDTMARLAARLAPLGFVRVHRSAIVNADAVRAVAPMMTGGYNLLLRDGSTVRSGRRYRLEVQSLMGREAP
jgi:two-component system, LytTR family, response regulator